MNIRCPHCQTLFRVDPTRVPAHGIRARCARCSGTFQIPGTAAAGAAPVRPEGEAEGGRGAEGVQGAGAGAGLAEQPAAPPSFPEPVRAREPEPEPASAPEPEPDSPTPAAASAPLPPSASAPEAPAAPEPAPMPAAAAESDTPTPPRPRPVFGSRDPQARALRIARALVSDIVAYHPGRREKALAEGTLRAEFRDEIMKSWEEYVAQVGQEVAKSTPYFRQSLNEILAQGQNIF